jgi:hypothetical protein
MAARWERAGGPAGPCFCAVGGGPKHLRNIPGTRFTSRKHWVPARETPGGQARPQYRSPERRVA